jgi:hypothetical protein
MSKSRRRRLRDECISFGEATMCMWVNVESDEAAWRHKRRDVHKRLGATN